MPEQRKYTEAQKQSARKWDAANLDRLSIAVPKGRKEEIKAHADTHDESVNGFINRAISEAMARDDGKATQTVTEAAQVTVEPLPSDTLEVAQRASEATGEEMSAFIGRAITTQAQRDKMSLRMGINPATGEKMDSGGSQSVTGGEDNE